MTTPPQKQKVSSPPKNSNSSVSSRGGSRAIATRIKLINQLVQERMEEVKRNSSLKLHTQNSLAEAIGWSASTIRDDIKDMEAQGYPITFDRRRNGYIYTEKFSGIPTAFITETDLAKLCLALRALESLKGSPLFKLVQKAVDKLTRGLTEKFGIDLEALKSTVTFRSTGVDAMTDPTVLETLMHAIHNREKLEVVYSKLNPSSDTSSNGALSRSPNKPRVNASEPEACNSSHSSNDANKPSSPNTTIPHPAAPWLSVPIETRKVQPLHILCQDNVWYLYVWDPMRKDKRRFTISRIRSISRTGETFKPRKFDIECELADRIGVTSGEPVDIKILFRRKASLLVAERPWHHSQKLTPGPDSEWNLELTMHVALTPELERWLFGFDEDFKVIEPASLKAAVHARSQAITRNHSV